MVCQTQGEGSVTLTALEVARVQQCFARTSANTTTKWLDFKDVEQDGGYLHSGSLQLPSWILQHLARIEYFLHSVPFQEIATEERREREGERGRECEYGRHIHSTHRIYNFAHTTTHTHKHLQIKKKLTQQFTSDIGTLLAKRHQYQQKPCTNNKYSNLTHCALQQLYKSTHI